VSSSLFPGYPAFVAAAEAELGSVGAAAPVRRIVPLTDLANLCAQASLAAPSRRSEILARAAEFRDQLAIALRAAELMLAHVENGAPPPPPPSQPRPVRGPRPQAGGRS
jgi:hypothetical protein